MLYYKDINFQLMKRQKSSKKGDERISREIYTFDIESSSLVIWDGKAISSKKAAKKAAKAAGDKSIEMLHVKDLLATTGYIRGGCSPVGMKKKYPTYFQEDCKEHQEIAVSAGERGHQMILSPTALISLIGGNYVDIVI